MRTNPTKFNPAAASTKGQNAGAAARALADQAIATVGDTFTNTVRPGTARAYGEAKAAAKSGAAFAAGFVVNFFAKK